MEQSQSPKLGNCWRCDGKTTQHALMNHLSLLGFQQLKRFLHVCDHTGANSKEVFFDKHEPLMTTVMQKSKSLWLPGCAMSFNEMVMIQHKRSFETVRVRNEPLGAGSKVRSRYVSTPSKVTMPILCDSNIRSWAGLFHASNMECPTECMYLLIFLSNFIRPDNRLIDLRRRSVYLNLRTLFSFLSQVLEVSIMFRISSLLRIHLRP